MTLFFQVSSAINCLWHVAINNKGESIELLRKTFLLKQITLILTLTITSELSMSQSVRKVECLAVAFEQQQFQSRASSYLARDLSGQFISTVNNLFSSGGAVSGDFAKNLSRDKSESSSNLMFLNTNTSVIFHFLKGQRFIFPYTKADVGVQYFITPTNLFGRAGLGIRLNFWKDA